MSNAALLKNEVGLLHRREPTGAILDVLQLTGSSPEAILKALDLAATEIEASGALIAISRSALRPHRGHRTHSILPLTLTSSALTLHRVQTIFLTGHSPTPCLAGR